MHKIDIGVVWIQEMKKSLMWKEICVCGMAKRQRQVTVREGRDAAHVSARTYTHDIRAQGGEWERCQTTSAVRRNGCRVPYNGHKILDVHKINSLVMDFYLPLGWNTVTAAKIYCSPYLLALSMLPLTIELMLTTSKQKKKIKRFLFFEGTFLETIRELRSLLLNLIHHQVFPSLLFIARASVSSDIYWDAINETLVWITI